jgi:cell division protein ZapA (FtsZ GTPase activity inhibitor)
MNSHKRDLVLTLLGRRVSVLVPPEEEPILTEAAEEVEQKVAVLRKSYGVSDEVQVLLMCCLDLATEAVQARLESSAQRARLHAVLDRLDGQMERMLHGLPTSLPASMPSGYPPSLAQSGRVLSPGPRLSGLPL